jgi:hypothetical protein
VVGFTDTALASSLGPSGLEANSLRREHVAVGGDEVAHAHRRDPGDLFDGVGGSGEQALLEVTMTAPMCWPT